MRSVLRILRRHLGKAILLLLSAAVALALASSSELRARGHAGWRQTLTWAGFLQASEDSGKVYWCPMHPQIKSSKENAVCPICNMALVELEGGVVEAPEHLTLTARQVQQTGVATEPALRRSLYQEIDATGHLACDERRLANITSWIRGKSRIEKLHVNFTGAHVEQGELIAELYSPELIVAQQEYLVALDNDSRIGGRSLLESAQQKLLDQGMLPEQIQELHETRRIGHQVPVFAPFSGTVLERKVRQGDYVSEGDLMFQIADLSQLWLFAEIYETDLPFIEVGQVAGLSVRSLPGHRFEGTVSFIDPVVQPQTRTVRVRIDVPNPNAILKPGMYARVQLQRRLPETLAVPEDSVLWSGQRAAVVVQIGNGLFQPREVRLGRKWLYSQEREEPSENELEFGAERQRYHEVLAGVSPGEQVVTAGAFLLSAESQFQSVLEKLLPPASSEVTLEAAIGETLAKGVRQLLEAYFALSQSLADDQLDQVPLRLAAVRTAAESLAQKAEAEGAAELAQSAREIAAHAFTDRAMSDPHQARSVFGRVSRATIQLMAEHGGQTMFGEDLFLFRCGMAKVGYENWLWWSEEKLNPYMGRKMLDCGTQLESLEP